MKMNPIGTLAVVGVVVSFTVACSGSPTKPAAAIPSFGQETPGASVRLTPFQEVAVEQICAAQAAVYDDEADDGNEVAPMVCDPADPDDESKDEAVVSDTSAMDSARFAR